MMNAKEIASEIDKIYQGTKSGGVDDIVKLIESLSHQAPTITGITDEEIRRLAEERCPSTGRGSMRAQKKFIEDAIWLRGKALTLKETACHYCGDDYSNLDKPCPGCGHCNQGEHKGNESGEKVFYCKNEKSEGSCEIQCMYCEIQQSK